MTIALIVATAGLITSRPALGEGGREEFNVTAGNTFFDQSPALGIVATFDFGDPAGEYNILTGFNGAHIYRNPGDYTLTVYTADGLVRKTIHVLPDRRGLMKLQSRDQLSDIAAGLQNNTVVLVPAGGTWDISRPLDLKARNIEFRADGQGPAPRFRRIFGNGSSSIVVQGLDTTFRGIEFDSDKEMSVVGNQKVNYKCVTADTAHVTFEHCTFRNVDDAIFCTMLARGVLAQSCKFTDEVRSCDLWCGGSNLVLLGNKMATSQREHNVRNSTQFVYNILVFDNDMIASHGKETLTLRNGQDLYAAHNWFHGWFRVGPGPHPDGHPMSPAELQKAFCRYIVLEKNAFTDGGWLQINEGSSEVIARDNRIDVDNVGIPVRIQGPSLHNILLENNYRVLTAGPTEKPFHRVWGNVGPNDIVERGTTNKTVDEAKALMGK